MGAVPSHIGAPEAKGKISTTGLTFILKFAILFIKDFFAFIF